MDSAKFDKMRAETGEKCAKISFISPQSIFMKIVKRRKNLLTGYKKSVIICGYTDKNVIGRLSHKYKRGISA